MVGVMVLPTLYEELGLLDCVRRTNPRRH